MKQYVFDQLRVEDHDRIQKYLQQHGDETAFSEVFWISLPEELYSDVQKQHPECRPHYFAVNLSYNKVEFELLIRSRQILRCACIGYANREQRAYIIDYADRMLDELDIRI